MSRIVTCPYCGLNQDEPQGAKQCMRCGGHLELQARAPSLVFICYTRKDAEFVNQLTADLKALGVNTWRDVDNITEQRQANLGGWRSAIEDALQKCTEMLVVLSPDSVASTEVDAEWNDFASRKLSIFPILISECKVPYYLRRYQIWDLRTDYTRQVAQLANILLGKSALPNPPASRPNPESPIHQGQAGLPARSVNRPIHPPSTPTTGIHRPARVLDTQASAGTDLSVIGQELWRIELVGEIKTAPQIAADGTIFVITHNGMLSAVHPKGKLLWQAILGGASAWTNAALPVITKEKKVLVVYNNQLMTFEEDGAPGWTFKKAGSLTCAPAVAQDGKIFLMNNNSILWAVSKDGHELWKQPLCQIMGGGTWPSPVVGADGSVFAVCKGTDIYNLDPNNGALRWTFNTNDKMESAPIASPDGKVYFASSGGWVFAMDKKGKPVWQVSVAGPPGFIQMIDAPVVLGADGLIYVAPRHGTLYALDARDGHLKWSAPVGGQGVGNHPVAVNSEGYVFARNLQGVMIAISTQGKILWRVTGEPSAAFSAPVCGLKNKLIFGIGRQLVAFQLTL